MNQNTSTKFTDVSIVIIEAMFPPQIKFVGGPCREKDLFKNLQAILSCRGASNAAIQY